MVTIWSSDYDPEEWADMMAELGLPRSTFRFSIDPTAVVDYEAMFPRDDVDNNQ